MYKSPLSNVAETNDVSSDVSTATRYYIYILYSLRDNGWYIGFTANLKNRLKDHARGQVTSTHSRTPLKLIHYEYFINITDAKAREKFLKSGYGRQQIKAFLKETIHESP